jgi:hypothetical protein
VWDVVPGVVAHRIHTHLRERALIGVPWIDSAGAVVQGDQHRLVDICADLVVD